MPSEKATIVFLDSSTIDIGDVTLQKIDRLGRLITYKNSTQDQIVSRAQKADIVITNKCVLDKTILGQLPRLRLICVAATGVNNVNLKIARKRKIAVTNVAGYSTTTVAEHTLLFLLAFSHRLMEHHQSVIGGHWSRSPHFTDLSYPFSDLSGKTFGIIGYGTIGKKVARLTKAFGMRVLIAKIPGRHYRLQEKRARLKTLLSRSDYVSLHCSLTKKTYHLINSHTLSQMRPSAFLLNLARGPVADENAIALALKRKQLAGYATDVLKQEPPPKNHPLFDAATRDKVLFTPHIAWASRESRQRLIDEMGKNIEAFLREKKRNRVV